MQSTYISGFTDEIEDICVEWKDHFDHKYDHIFNDFEFFCDKMGFDELSIVKVDIAAGYSVIREEFFKINGQLKIFDKIRRNLRNQSEMFENPLEISQKFSKALVFKRMVDETAPVMHNDLFKYMSSYHSTFNEKERSSKLNMISQILKIPLSVSVITKYHEQSRNLGWSLSDFLDKSTLLQELNNLNNKMGHKNAYKKLIREWIMWYDQNVYKPLPKYREQLRQLINHDINVVIPYYTQIIDAVHWSKYFGSSPIQFDVFFVPALSNASAAKIDAQFATFSDSHKVLFANRDTHWGLYCGAFRLLKMARLSLSLKHGNRMIMVIVRKNQNHCNNDDIYLFVSDNSNNVSDDFASISELPWLANTKSDIIPGLNPQTNGILGISHHIHSDQRELVYMAYEGFCSRVFKNDFIDYLPVLFKEQYCTLSPIHSMELNDSPYNIAQSRNGFNADFRGLKYQKYGEYFFGTSRYECFKAEVKFNVFVPQNIPRDLLNLIYLYLKKGTKCFEDSLALHCHLDHSFDMQYGGMVYYDFYRKNGKGILVINTELYNKNGKELYVIQSKLRCEIMLVNVCGCLMTKEEICSKWCINELDLPKASITKHK